MAKRQAKKITKVHAHPLHVPVSKKNPDSITIRDEHLRRLKGTYLDRNEIEKVYIDYDKSKIKYPAKGKLPFKDGDKYDDEIAVWVDYFNKKLEIDPPLDPDVLKSLIASESKFQVDPSNNPKADGICQITPQTFKIVQDLNGEAKAFLFKNIRKKDLKNPSIAIPIAARWLSRKMKLAEHKLGRTPDIEEIILEYKGLLKSNTKWKNKALENFRDNYARLKKK